MDLEENHIMFIELLTTWFHEFPIPTVCLFGKEMKKIQGKFGNVVSAEQSIYYI